MKNLIRVMQNSSFRWGFTSNECPTGRLLAGTLWLYLYCSARVSGVVESVQSDWRVGKRSRNEDGKLGQPEKVGVFNGPRKRTLLTFFWSWLPPFLRYGYPAVKGIHLAIKLCRLLRMLLFSLTPLYGNFCNVYFVIRCVGTKSGSSLHLQDWW